MLMDPNRMQLVQAERDRAQLQKEFAAKLGQMSYSEIQAHERVVDALNRKITRLRQAMRGHRVKF